MALVGLVLGVVFVIVPLVLADLAKVSEIRLHGLVA